MDSKLEFISRDMARAQDRIEQVGQLLQFEVRMAYDFHEYMEGVEDAVSIALRERVTALNHQVV